MPEEIRFCRSYYKESNVYTSVRCKNDKDKCPICVIEGVLQTKGNHQHIQHYQSFVNGKRTYTYHKVQVTNPILSSDKQNGGPVEIRTPDLWLVKPTS